MYNSHYLFKTLAERRKVLDKHFLHPQGDEERSLKY